MKTSKAEKSGLKNVYKKSLAIAVIKAGHDFHHSMRNYRRPAYQVYVFVETPELIRDMIEFSKRGEMSA